MKLSGKCKWYRSDEGSCSSPYRDKGYDGQTLHHPLCRGYHRSENSGIANMWCFEKEDTSTLDYIVGL